MLLELHGVWCRWRPPGRELLAHELPTYLMLEEGEWLALLGTNGVGKTTLLKAVAGLGIYSGGVVRLDGRALGTGDILARYQAGVAYVGQDAALKNRTMLWSDAVAVATATRPGLQNDGAIADLRSRLAGAGLLRGEQVPARVFDLAVSLIAMPRLLILDEIGRATREVAPGCDIYGLLRALLPRTAVVFVEHDIRAAIAATDKVLWMRPARFAAPAAAPPRVFHKNDGQVLREMQQELGQIGEPLVGNGGLEASDVLSEWDSPRAVIELALRAAGVARHVRARLLKQMGNSFAWLSARDDVGALSGGQRVILAKLICAAMGLPFGEQQLFHVDQSNQIAIAEVTAALAESRVGGGTSP